MLIKQVVADEAGYAIGFRFSLIDARDGGERWSAEFTEDDEYYSPTVLGDLTNAEQLFLLFVAKSSELPNSAVAVDLATGSQTSFEVKGHFDETLGRGACPLDETALVASHYAVSVVRAKTASDSEGAGQTTAHYLARTDLLNGEYTVLPLSELGEYGEGFTDGTLDVDDCSLSPTGKKLVIPLENTRDEEYQKKTAVSFGLLDVGSGQLTQLPLELCPNVYGIDQYTGSCAVWADDGQHFVMAGAGDLVVFDAQGTKVASLSMGDREVFSVTLQGNRLLVAYQEEADVMLLSYDLVSGEVTGRCVLPGLNVDSILLENFVWAWASSDKRDPGDICLLYSGKLFLVSYEPFGVCQVVDDCAGYDDAARAFVVVKTVQVNEVGDYGNIYVSYPRHTIDDLMNRGQEVLGASAMSDVERESYGM